MAKKWIKVWKVIAGFLLFLFLLSRFLLPNPEFISPTSTVLEDSTGVVMAAGIASDGQWRFPSSDTVPEKFKVCITQFEDRYFYRHFGINPVSVWRAFQVNVKAGRVVQGGSTITMQVARMLRNGRQRTMWQKFIEVLLTLHIEINYTKNEILNLYASNAPFGGNVVGLNAASWRYYGRDAGSLTWAEMAALAVLPNAPSLVYPGKNERPFRLKRDRLLHRLFEQGFIDQSTYSLSLLEPLPGKPHPFPRYAVHLFDKANRLYTGQTVRSSIDAALQDNIQKMVNRYIDRYAHNKIHNAAVIVLEPQTGKIVAYVGNATQSNAHGNAVDIINAPRSTGSTLKPFLYAAMLSEGELLSDMLVADIPTFFRGYSPKNYYQSFDGAVAVSEALYRSLNVPFVRLLREYRYERLHALLRSMGMHSLIYPSTHYGLSLILGGAEGSLLELSSMYAGMVRRLLHYTHTGSVSGDDFIRFSAFQTTRKNYPVDQDKMGPAAIYTTFDVLTEVKRPISRSSWKMFGSSRKIAWKTGTSFGNKDAWAIGVTPQYVVGVWVGNADGEGRASMTGAGFASPIMFEVFDKLPATGWFELPRLDMLPARVCRASGYKASFNCDMVDTVLVGRVIQKSGVCPYHVRVHLDTTETYRVNTDCESRARMVSKSWFVLPPVQEWFYREKHPLYRVLPPYRDDCRDWNDVVMAFIYPKPPNKIFIPKELSGKKGRAVFKIAHREPHTTIYWHLDGELVGQTQDFHQLEILAFPGKHQLIVVDEQGNEMMKNFEVVE